MRSLMRPLALVALVATGCAHAALRPAAPATPFVPAAGERRPPEHESIDAILASAGLAYVTVEPHRRWLIGFARVDPAHPEPGPGAVVVQILGGEVFTVVMGRLGTAPPHASAAFFRGLARRNFDLAQLKLGLDADDEVYASFEVPSRLLDRQELLEDVFTLAKLMSEPKSSLFGLPPDPLQRSAPPEAAGPVIEARR